MKMTQNDLYTPGSEVIDLLNGRPDGPQQPYYPQHELMRHRRDVRQGILALEQIHGGTIWRTLQDTNPSKEGLRLAIEDIKASGREDITTMIEAVLTTGLDDFTTREYYDQIMAISVEELLAYPADAEHISMANWKEPYQKPYVASEPEPELTRTEQIRKLASHFETEPVWRLRTMVAQGVSGPDEYKTLHDIIDASYPRYMSKFEEIVGPQVIERMRP